MDDGTPPVLPVLVIDEKWSVSYRPDENDRPDTLFRHGEPHVCSPRQWDNPTVAMFYALLAARKPLEGDDDEHARRT